MRQPKQRITAQGLDLKDQVISINRVTKVVKGGKNLSKWPGCVASKWKTCKKFRVSSYGDEEAKQKRSRGGEDQDSVLPQHNRISVKAERDRAQPRAYKVEPNR